MKRLAFFALCLALCVAALTTSPTPAAASCHEGCCDFAYQRAESHCASIGSYVTYFNCIEGYMGSCCTIWYNCAPPPQ